MGQVPKPTAEFNCLNHTRRPVGTEPGPLILPGARLQRQVAAALLLVAVRHEVVLVAVSHRQAVRHERIIARLLQHLVLVGRRPIVRRQQCGRRRIGRVGVRVVQQHDAADTGWTAATVAGA
uniref:Uncharacterized protein n=1 Tax=Anopheles coluzzii TaxID=1518534 RepID=A0A8W7PKF7_ANOCL